MPHTAVSNHNFVKGLKVLGFIINNKDSSVELDFVREVFTFFWYASPSVALHRVFSIKNTLMESKRQN